MKVFIDAILHTVHDVESTEKGSKQQIMFRCPQYDKFTGEKKRDDFFPAVILGSVIERLNAKALEGEIVRATCFLNTYERTTDKQTFHNLSLSCLELELKKNT